MLPPSFFAPVPMNGANTDRHLGGAGDHCYLITGITIIYPSTLSATAIMTRHLLLAVLVESQRVRILANRATNRMRSIGDQYWFRRRLSREQVIRQDLRRWS